MDAEELKEWVLPEDFDHSNSEAKHLIDEVDNNKVADKYLEFKYVTIVVISLRGLMEFQILNIYFN